MDIPFSFELAYTAERAVLEEVQNFAGTRLEVLCKRHTWLFDDRLKEPESVLAKLQLGELRALADMQDFYAAMVVVPTLAELEKATGEVMAEFKGATRKPSRIADPDVFQYDDVHVIGSLGALGPIASESALKRRFEVQIRTGLQYAWWRATHDELYKPEGAPDWRLRRMASQLRASLELVDSALGDLRTAAELLEQRDPDVAEVQAQRFGAMLDRWSDERRPQDSFRFSENVTMYLEASETTYDELEGLLDGAEGRRLVNEATVTPAQAVFALLVQEKGLVMCERMVAMEPPRYALITDEMELACPSLAGIPAAQRVKFTVGPSS